MDPRQITRLAKLLRENGDKVLSSEYKITLTGSLLRALNDSFTLITDPNETCTPNTFQVLKPNNAKSEVFRELQFIYDFVQKAQILCLVALPTEDPFDGEIDIKKFRNLKRLEIKKIPIEQIVGIQRLRAHIQELICSKSISSIQSIIAHCGGDNANGFLWNELRMADFSYNCLKTIDCSLEFVSNLQQLNLSHNQIVSVDAIKWLPNLKKLNLGYNNLSQIPQSIVSRRLQSLILTNNFIENLHGLPKLEALNELNLSDNCILDHAALGPLGALIALEHLQLQGNPIACHPNHREETCKYLHKNIASVKFVLDSQPLSNQEKRLVGYYKPKKVEKLPSFIETPIVSQYGESPPSSIGSYSQLDSSTADFNEFGTSHRSTMRRIKVRPALIDDDDSDDGVGIVKTKKVHKKKEKPKPKPPSPDFNDSNNGEHLETKMQIEKLRNEFGDEWLRCKSASKVQDAMGIQVPTKSIWETSEKECNLFYFGSEGTIGSDRTSTPVQQLSHADFPHSPIEQYQSPISSTNEFKSVVSEHGSKAVESEASTAVDESKTISASDGENVWLSIPISEPEPDIISDTEDNEEIYFATNEVNQMDILLIVSDQSIREKKPLTTKTINKWTMNMLESCEHIATDVVRIRFDTIKRDKRERTYSLEKDHGRKIDDFLRNILSQRPLSDLMIIYKCANCAMHFSQEKLQRKNGRDVLCPECGSSYVIEMKESESSPPKQSTPPKNSPPLQEQVHLTKSSSHSSIDSASSFNESLSQSKLSALSQSSFDSNQSLIGSTTNCEHTNDLDSYFASRFGAPPESDVEILSNPSISSIEVLDRFSRQSSRKHSEDSRYLLQTHLYVQQHQHQFNKSNDGLDCQSPSLDLLIKSTSNSDIEEILDEPEHVTITQIDGPPATCNERTEVNDALLKPTKKTILTGMNLTESSSSGSVTDSVCTAYEHQAVEGKGIDEMVTTSVTTSTMTPAEQESAQVTEDDRKELEISKVEELSKLSTMFGGLFNSTNLLLTPKTPTKVDTAPCDKFKFSYTDFDSVDHRLKLYLYQTIFEDRNEQLKWLVKGCLFNDAINSDADAKLQPAIFVMSSTKWYVLNIIGHESEDMTKWLKRESSGTINRVEIIRVLPYKVGITFTIKHFGNIHFFLQDIMHTDSLLLFFANNPLPVYCDLEYQISERISQKVLAVTNNVQLKMFTILNSCKIIDHNDDTIVHEYAAFVLTDTHLYVTTPNYGWLVEKLSRDIELAQSQVMSDLIDFEYIDDTTIVLNFLDEIRDRKEQWECKFKTNNCLQNTFQSLATSWEKLFKVPLGNLSSKHQ